MLLSEVGIKTKEPIKRIESGYPEEQKIRRYVQERIDKSDNNRDGTRYVKNHKCSVGTEVG